MHPVNLTRNRQYLIPAPFPVIAFFYIKTDKIYISMFPVNKVEAKAVIISVDALDSAPIWGSFSETSDTSS